MSGQLQRSGRFTLGAQAADTHWVDPRTGPDALVKEKKVSAVINLITVVKLIDSHYKC